ncbi:MAG: hypothetical protein OXN15_00375, partial [Chloroflexota bacterium]|nr:hypothetical protein [Chloroflexota bacterium]
MSSIDVRLRFGTDGWRAVIAEEFTFRHVRYCAQGVADYHVAQGLAADPVIVGYDTRFQSAEFADAVVEVLAGNGLRVIRCTAPAPTPVVGYNLVHYGAAGGVMITASHNPFNWNGFKYRGPSGGSPPPEVLTDLEAVIQRVQESGEVRSLDLATARDAGLVTDIDPAPEYIAHVARLVDLDALRAVGCHVAVDAMHGAGAGYLTALLSGGATTVTEVRGNVNPAFPDMHNPEPIDRNLRPLRDAVLSSNALVGVAMDGDADRVGAIDGSGEYITALQVFGLLTYYLLEVRGFRGPLVKSLTTSNMVSRLGERYGVPVHETSVGFKYIAPLMLETDALIGGEESGGFGFRGHIPERDGVLSALFLLDLVARKGVTLSTVIDEIYGLVGPHHYDRLDVVFDAANRPAVEGRLFDATPCDLAGAPVVARATLDRQPKPPGGKGVKTRPPAPPNPPPGPPGGGGARIGGGTPGGVWVLARGAVG